MLYWILNSYNRWKASLIWERICLQFRRPQFDSWVRKISWRRDRLPTSVFLGFCCGSAGKESTCNVGRPWFGLWVRKIPSPLAPEKGKATHSSILAWRIPWTTVHGMAKSQTRLSDFHFLVLKTNPEKSPIGGNLKEIKIWKYQSRNLNV